MNFSQALHNLKFQKCISREGWNGKGMWLGLCTNWNGNVGAAGLNFKMLPFIYMRTAQGDFVPWLASQTDILADDWQIVEVSSDGTAIPVAQGTRGDQDGFDATQ